MFRAPLCPSSGTHDDSVGYHIGRLVLCVAAGWRLSAGRMMIEGCNTTVLEPFVGHSSILLALNFQPATTREPAAYVVTNAIVVTS